MGALQGLHHQRGVDSVIFERRQQRLGVLCCLSGLLHNVSVQKVVALTTEACQEVCSLSLSEGGGELGLEPAEPERGGGGAGLGGVPHAEVLLCGGGGGQQAGQRGGGSHRLQDKHCLLLEQRSPASLVEFLASSQKTAQQFTRAVRAFLYMDVLWRPWKQFKQIVCWYILKKQF